MNKENIKPIFHFQLFHLFVECSLQAARRGLRGVVCGVWGAGCGVRGAGCGKWNVG